LLAQVLERRSLEQTANQDVSRRHAEQRSHLGEYTVDQVMVEYRLLRKTLFEAIEKEEPLDTFERDLLHEAIDAGIGQAGAAFMQVHLARNAGQLRSLQSEGLHREQFVALMTHDLRNPLNTARLAIQLVARHRDTPDVLRGYALRAIEHLDRVDRMIQDLLDANRVRAGEKLALNVVDCDITELLEQVLDELRVAYGERFVLAAPGPIMGRFDREAIRRMVENLSTNAVKYGAEESLISVSLADAGESVILSVHNEGPPLSVEEQSRVLEPFQRTHEAVASGKRGWGLGLTIVRGVVDAHGGTLEIQSAPGKGVTIVARLPRASR
jgi:signal transduction histidine kinase